MDLAQLRMPSEIIMADGRANVELSPLYLLTTIRVSDLASEKPILKIWPQQPLKYPKAAGFLAVYTLPPFGVLCFESLLY